MADRGGVCALMANWFLRGVRQGVVTTAYPRHVDLSSADLPVPPTFDAGRLESERAARLVAICPSSALSVEALDLVLDVGRCTGCQRCLPLAGDAGRSSASFEWASRDREALRIHFPLGASS